MNKQFEKYQRQIEDIRKSYDNSVKKINKEITDTGTKLEALKTKMNACVETGDESTYSSLANQVSFYEKRLVMLEGKKDSVLANAMPAGTDAQLVIGIAKVVDDEIAGVKARLRATSEQLRADAEQIRTDYEDALDLINALSAITGEKYEIDSFTGTLWQNLKHTAAIIARAGD